MHDPFEPIYFSHQEKMTHPFAQKNLVFTGALSSMTRSTAAKLAKACGATIQGAVTEQTHFVIVGDKQQVKSSKYMKAEQLIFKGSDLQLLEESDFLWLVAIRHSSVDDELV